MLPLLPILLCLLSTVIADVSIKSPEAGATYSASGGAVLVQIKWEDDGDDLTTDLTTVKSYTISLCSGSNDKISCFKTILLSGTVSGNLYTASIKSTDAPSGNFFFQILASFPTGTSIHYSERFTLSGMSGSATTQVLDGSPVTLVLTDTEAAPSPQVSVGDDNKPLDSASFLVPYTEQTGKTRYAPMQLQPGTTVTMTAWTRQFPTSSVLYALTFMSKPYQKTTKTPGWSYTMMSAPNWASPATYPNQWYAAKERVTPAALSSAVKRKRWQ